MARLAVMTHKLCWESPGSPAGYATDGGFPFQMEALSELFDATTLVLPTSVPGSRNGEMPLQGNHLSVVTLSPLARGSVRRKLLYPFWLVRNLPVIIRELRRADAIHAPIPGDVGTSAMLLALLFRKPLFVRHCGNWMVQTTWAERFCRWFMERFAGGRNVMLATGGADTLPSARNPAVEWIFSTTLRDEELRANIPQPGRVLSRSPRLIVACRQEKAKGTDRVIESLPALLKTHPQLMLDVVGDGSHLGSLQSQVQTLGLQSHVVFHGKVNHSRVLELLKAADIFCFPTTSSEGFPKGVLEALSCGLPIVTTRVSVLPQLLKNGCGSLLSDPTPAAVAEAVNQILSDPARYQSMSAQATLTAESFSLERWRDQIGTLLRKAWGPLRDSEDLGR